MFNVYPDWTQLSSRIRQFVTLGDARKSWRRLGNTKRRARAVRPLLRELGEDAGLGAGWAGNEKYPGSGSVRWKARRQNILEG